MLYEELKANRGTVAHQMLLQPVTVTLEKNEYAAVLNALGLYELSLIHIYRTIWLLGNLLSWSK